MDILYQLDMYIMNVWFKEEFSLMHFEMIVISKERIDPELLSDWHVIFTIYGTFRVEYSCII